MNRQRKHLVEPLESRLLMAVVSVLNTNDSGAGSLRDAISVAQAGDTVSLSDVSGTITLQSAVTIGKDLTVAGPGAGKLTIDGNDSVLIFAVAGGTVTMSGLTLSHGRDVNGGAINNAGMLTLSNVVLSHNTATSNGGAIANYNTLTATDCTFDANAVSSPGIQAEGGAIYHQSGRMDLTGCTFSGNSCSAFDPMEGGAAWGGAVSSRSDSTFTNCTFSGNTATGGFGIMGSGQSIAGAIIFIAGTSSVTNCTVTGGSAQYGGGLYFYGTGSFTVTNSIVAGNTDQTSFPDVGTNSSGHSGGHNLIGVSNSGSAFINGVNGDLVGSSASPLDAKLLALADNAGPTKTVALQAGSPAIDAGNDATAPAADQRGAARTGTSDIGAFEFDGTVPSSNHAPVFADGTTTRLAVTGNAFSWTVSATDADGDALSFGATGLPSWLTLKDNHDGTAALSGTPSNADTGTSDITVTVSDGKGSTDRSLELGVVLPRWQLDQSGLLTVGGEAGNDDLRVWVRKNKVRISRDGVVKDFEKSKVKQVEVYGLDGDDVITINTASIPAYACGGAGNDTLTGGDEYDVFTGGGGNDRLFGGGGHNRLNGLGGRDIIVGSGDVGGHDVYDRDPLDRLINLI